MKPTTSLIAAIVLMLTAQSSLGAEPNRMGQPGSPPTAAKDPDNYTLAQLCAHKALSAEDQAD